MDTVDYYNNHCNYHLHNHFVDRNSCHYFADRYLNFVVDIGYCKTLVVLVLGKTCSDYFENFVVEYMEIVQIVVEVVDEKRYVIVDC